ncbi:hypothetical protein [Arthrobacter sp. MMS24-S77]
MTQVMWDDMREVGTGGSRSLRGQAEGANWLLVVLASAAARWPVRGVLVHSFGLQIVEVLLRGIVEQTMDWTHAESAARSVFDGLPCPSNRC